MTRRRPCHRIPRRALQTALACATVLIALGACGRGGPTPAPPPEPLPAPVAPLPAGTFAYSPGTFQVTLESRSVVRVAPDTSAERQGIVSGATAGSAPNTVPPGPGSDTVVTRIRAILDLPPGSGTLLLRGSVDSVTVQSLGGSTAGSTQPDSTPRQPLTSPLFFTGTVDGGVVSIPPIPQLADDCSSPAGAYLAQATALLPSLPVPLAPGATWTDTTTNRSCRGGVALTTTAINSYSVAGESGATTTVARTTRYRLTGAGSQAGQQVSVSGEGSGSGELLVDVPGGRVLTTRGSATLRLTFEGAGRRQEVMQETEQRLTINAFVPPAPGAPD